jgi:diguanylate cyclase (GGDEF)-like protein
MGLRAKLSLLIPSLVAAALVGQGLLAAEVELADRTVELARHEALALRPVAAPAARLVSAGQRGEAAELLEEVRVASELVGSLALVGPEGGLLAAAGPRVPGKASLVLRAVRSRAPAWERLPGGGGLLVAVPATAVRGAPPQAALLAQVSTAELEASARRTRSRWAVLAAGMAVLLSVGLYLVFDRVVGAPLRLLRNAARRMGEGDLGARAPPLAGRELGEVAGALNQMASALGGQRDVLERAVAERTRALEEANGRLARLAVTDGLTGVYNHRHFREALAREASRAGRTGRPLSLLLLDVDHFKRFNDTRGHPAGDALLRELAATLQVGLRGADVLARYGGEEFALLLPDTGEEGAREVAERLRAAVEHRFGATSDPSPIAGGVTVSVGVATWPGALAHGAPEGEGAFEAGPHRAAEELLESADRALYAAKRGGRNRVAEAAA